MKLTLPEYNRLKARVDALQSEADRDEGARDRARQQLKDVAGGHAPDDLIEQAERMADEAEKDYLRQLERFEKEWEGKIDG